MMDKIAICAIFKDEAPFLLEWLAFHKMIGADLFVLYDNGSCDGGGDLIRASSFARNVTLIDWLDRPGQLSAYNHFRINHAPGFTWAAFIDIDEFIVPAAGSSIRDILIAQGLPALRADPCCNGWCSGHLATSAGQTAWCWKTTRAGCRNPPMPPLHRIKTLVRTEFLTGIDYTPHAAECSGPACNTRGEAVLPYAIQPTECHEVMAIHHYFTKSADDWAFKRLRRGRGDLTGTVSGAGVR